jgi:hypothetical protein
MNGGKLGVSSWENGERRTEKEVCVLLGCDQVDKKIE